MPWSPPSFEAPIHDPRIERFRDRAARIGRRDGRVGTVYFGVSIEQARPEGHLWWRRWSAPLYLVDGYVWGDAEVTSTFDPSGRYGPEYRVSYQARDGDLEQLLDEADRGVFTWLGEEWQLEWLGDEEMARFREERRNELDG